MQVCGDPCACIKDTVEYQSLLDDYNEEVCALASKFTINGHNLIGDPVEDGCGGGDPKEFQSDVADFLEAYARPAGIATLVIAGILVFGTIFGLIVFCTTSKEDKKRQENLDQAANAGVAQS